MKKIFTLLMVTLVVSAQAQTPSPELLNHFTFVGLKNEVKADYGTLQNPLPSGTFVNIANRSAMQTQTRKLQNSYRWPDGSVPDFSKRGSMQGKNGIVDMYTLINANSKDTIRLYVDPYHAADSYFVPKGLVAMNSKLLAKEIAPLVKIAEELNDAPDASILQETSSQLLGAINKQVGTDFLVDGDVIAPIATDKEADKPFIGYLIRSYVFAKFLAYAKNIKDPKSFATKKMKENFEKYTSLHPEVKAGTLKETIK